jgi:hypothetical protein
MKVKVFLETAGNFDEREILLKMYEGILKIHPVDRSDDLNRTGTFLEIGQTFSDCDVAVMMGSWKPRDRDHHVLRNSIVENARCFVVIETPLLNRVMFQKSTHHRIGVNGFLNNQGTFHHNDHDALRTKKLGITWDDWKNKEDGNILLMLQLPGDASLRGVNIYTWASNAVSHLRKHTDRDIVIRTHPSHNPKDGDEFYKFSFDLTKKYKNIRFSFGSEKSVQEEFDNAYCTVSYTSGSSIDSVLAGIPVLATDPGNFTFEISSNYFEEINDLKKLSRSKINNWINRLSYSQWTTDEMRSGEVWQHIEPLVSNAISMAQIKRKK